MDGDRRVDTEVPTTTVLCTQPKLSRQQTAVLYCSYAHQNAIIKAKATATATLVIKWWAWTEKSAHDEQHNYISNDDKAQHHLYSSIPTPAPDCTTWLLESGKR
jgi:hypothetical protein